MRISRLQKATIFLWLISGAFFFETNGQSTLWGLTNYQYGRSTVGNIFSTIVPSRTTVNNYNFNINGLRSPQANLVVTNKKLYGVTYRIGLNAFQGNIYEFDFDLKRMAKMWSFTDTSSFSSSVSNLLLAKNGNIYFMDFTSSAIIKELNPNNENILTKADLSQLESYIELTNMVETDSGNIKLINVGLDNFDYYKSIVNYNYISDTLTIDTSIYFSNDVLGDNSFLYVSLSNRGYTTETSFINQDSALTLINEIDFLSKTITDFITISEDTLLFTGNSRNIIIEYNNGTILGIGFSGILNNYYLFVLDIVNKKFNIKRTNIYNDTLQDFTQRLTPNGQHTFNPRDIVFSLITGKVYGLSSSGGDYGQNIFI